MGNRGPKPNAKSKRSLRIPRGKMVTRSLSISTDLLFDLDAYVDHLDAAGQKASRAQVICRAIAEYLALHHKRALPQEWMTSFLDAIGLLLESHGKDSASTQA